LGSSKHRLLPLIENGRKCTDAALHLLFECLGVPVQLVVLIRYGSEVLFRLLAHVAAIFGFFLDSFHDFFAEISDELPLRI